MTRSTRSLALRGLVCIGGSALPLAASAVDADPSAVPSNPATAQELKEITVIGNTPLQGLGLPLNQIPANVQVADAADMQRQQTLDLADYLNNNFSGINVSESSDNPFQLDINYHGFTASPLLGLNTLGGALSVRTKSGHENPGTEFEAYGGSFGRRSFRAETGGEAGNFDYFLTGNYFDEIGWRDMSPTKVYQGFGKVGWQNDETDVDLSYTYADTRLYGNGAAPLSMLDYRRETSYTPDFTQNLLNFVNLTGTQFLTSDVLLSANLYYRRLITGSVNGNVNDSYLSSDYSGPPIDCVAPPTSRAGLAFCAAGQNATSRLNQRTAGVGVQLTDSQDLFGWENQAILGADYDASRDTFAQALQYGPLAPDRSLIYEPNPLNNETVISLSGSNKISSVYLTDTLSPSKLLHLTASVRYNRNTETLNGYSVDTDVGDVGSGFDQASPLAGDHAFSRINPAFGFTVTPTDALTFYADYNEASRAPTVIELGCANPAAPCGLPNDFASDPDLKQVVARTVEVGARGNSDDKRLTWSVDLFHTVNGNDIQFVATSTNQGYFNNVGNTRRQGADLSVGAKVADLSWRLVYSLVEATFESNFEVNGGSNSTADENGNIQVRAGDRLPLVPRHSGRVVLDYAPKERW